MGIEFRTFGLGSRVQDVGFRALALGFRVRRIGLVVALRFWVQTLGFGFWV